MTIKITQPYEQLQVQNIILYYYALPSMLKTTLAMTAEDALVINFDKGAHRVDNYLRRCAVMDVDTWNDIKAIKVNDLAPFKTIIIDTVGMMQECARMLVAEDKKNTFNGGILKQPAHGIVNNLINTFLRNLKAWKKDIVLIAHAIEDKDNQDRNIIRPDLGGKLRQELYRLSDCMALINFEQHGNNLNRALQFMPNQDHLAKDCANLGSVVIPDLYQDAAFLARLIQNIKNKINSLSPEDMARMKLLQEEALWQSQCSEARSSKDFNNLTLAIKELRVTKGKDDPQCKAMWKTLKPFATNLGFVFDDANAMWLESA